jgi:predicted anti-sigma-YlaC factor YlaD
MTTCDRIRQNLLLAGTGELPSEEKATLDRHLAACSECRRFQADAAWIAAHAPVALEASPPVLALDRLETRARTRLAPLLPFRLPRVLAAAAALVLAILGAAIWLVPLLRPARAPEGLPRIALLDEWQFWLVSGLGLRDEDTGVVAFAAGWNEYDFARHLLALEGLLPEEAGMVEENNAEAIPEALPPITLRGYNTLAPLRS